MIILIHDYLDTVTTNNFILVQILPTRITSKSSTLIDNIYYYEVKLHKESKIKCGNFEWYYRLSHNYFLNLTNKISLKMIGQRYDYNNEYVLGIYID